MGAHFNINVVVWACILTFSRVESGNGIHKRIAGLIPPIEDVLCASHFLTIIVSTLVVSE